MKTDKIGMLDTSLYETPQVISLLEERGIKNKNESVQEVFQKVIDRLLSKDADLNNATHEALFAEEVKVLVEQKVIVFSSPLLMNIGKDREVSLGACTVLTVVNENGNFNQESFRSIAFKLLNAGVGIGYDISELNDPVNAITKINKILIEIDKKLKKENKRPSATMLTIRGDHPDILEIIRIKNKFDFLKSKFNISIFLNTDIFEIAKSNGKVDLVDSKNKIVSQINANVLIRSIASSAHYCGEPGILFKDRFENDNPTPHWPYVSTAPCAELAMAEGDVCHFGYINLDKLIKQTRGSKTFDFNMLSESVRILTRIMDSAVQISLEGNGLIDMEKISSRRRIGIGVLGFATLLKSLRISYESGEAALLATQISEYMDYSSKYESCSLARTRGYFPDFPRSRYIDKKWLRRKMDNATGIIPRAEWEQLFKSISINGLRNCSTLSFPPSGTSSRIAGVSPSIEPFFSNEENDRKPGSNHDFSKTALNISPSAHLRILYAFQKFSDDSASKTINMKNNSSIDEVEEILWQSYFNGIKGITVFRDGCLEERNLN